MAILKDGQKTALEACRISQNDKVYFTSSYAYIRS